MMKEKGWLIPYIKEQKYLFGFVLILSMIAMAATAALLFTSGYLISKSAMRPENILLVYVPIVAVRTFGILRSVSRYVERLASHGLILGIVSRMRPRLYRLLAPHALKRRVKTGEMLGVLANDIEHIQNMYVKTIFPSLAALFLYMICIMLLGFFSWPFAGLMAIYGLVLVLVLPIFSLLVVKAKQVRMKEGRHGLYERLTDGILGISDWTFSGRQASFVSSIQAEDRMLTELENGQTRFVRSRTFFAQLTVGVLVVTMLWWTGMQAETGELSKTLIAAFVLVVFPLAEAFLPLSDAMSDVPTYQNSIHRLNQLPAAEEEVSKTIINTEDGIHLQMQHVTFGYEDRLTIKDVSFELPSGKNLALIGPSGAGKSTIVKLLLGAERPMTGSVLLNDVPTHHVDEIARYIGVLNQQPHLFDTSIANNIRLGNPKASDEEVYEAGKQVGLHEYIASLPDGYHTAMLETGLRFSGGERQRIALARLLLQKTPVVILDEPTVGLDARTEKELLRTIFNVLQGKTVVWITHHLAGMNVMDEILFLEEGAIKMRGNHQALLREERYRHLYELDAPFAEETDNVVKKIVI